MVRRTGSSAVADPLVILHITARTKNFVPGMSRKDYKPAKEWYQDRGHSDPIPGAFFGE